MISFDDCIAFCGLTSEEVAAIAEHEHMPDVAATALANYLIHREHGPEMIRQMIVEDIQKAVADGRIDHAATLLGALRHYLSTHADAWPAIVGCNSIRQVDAPI